MQLSVGENMPKYKFMTAKIFNHATGEKFSPVLNARTHFNCQLRKKLTCKTNGDDT